MKLPIEQNIFISKKLSFFAFLIVCSLNTATQKKTYLNPKDTLSMNSEKIDLGSLQGKYNIHNYIETI